VKVIIKTMVRIGAIHMLKGALTLASCLMLAACGGGTSPQSNAVSTFAGTVIDGYIAAYTTSSSPGSTVYTGWSSLNHSFNAGGTVSLWRPSSYDSATNVSTRPVVIGRASYSARTVHGQQMLVIEAAAPENNQGELVIFAVKAGSLYGGSVRTASAKGNGIGLVSKTMINGTSRPTKNLQCWIERAKALKRCAQAPLMHWA
jgi:hypothetical protein